VHGVCGLDYYRAAIAAVAGRTAGPELFVFSDDLPWAKDNLRASLPMHFVDLNDASRNHFDLHLMAACRHQITANSSFSWWAAWLNSNPGKIIAAPRRWFSGKDYDARDLLPVGWLAV
jgi:hypothetical protein